VGSSRGPQRDHGPLNRRFDLRGQAAAFADELSALLNNTVTDGIRITAVTDKNGQQARIGYGIRPRNLSDPGMILCVPRMSSTALTSRVALPAVRP
jgi:hypothetical protein